MEDFDEPPRILIALCPNSSNRVEGFGLGVEGLGLKGPKYRK